MAAKPSSAIGKHGGESVPIIALKQQIHTTNTLKFKNECNVTASWERDVKGLSSAGSHPVDNTDDKKIETD